MSLVGTYERLLENLKAYIRSKIINEDTYNIVLNDTLFHDSDPSRTWSIRLSGEILLKKRGNFVKAYFRPMNGAENSWEKTFYKDYGQYVDEVNRYLITENSMIPSSFRPFFTCYTLIMSHNVNYSILFMVSSNGKLGIAAPGTVFSIYERHYRVNSMEWLTDF